MSHSPSDRGRRDLCDLGATSPQNFVCRAGQGRAAKANTGAVADSVILSISVAVPVPPTKCMSQTVDALGRGFVSVSVIVGLAPIPAPPAVMVHSQVCPVPTAPVTLALSPARAEGQFVVRARDALVGNKLLLTQCTVLNV